MTGVSGRVRRVLGSSRALRLALATSLIASLVVVAVERPVRAATQTFTTTADAQVQEANASTTFGTSTALRVDAGSDPGRRVLPPVRRLRCLGLGADRDAPALGDQCDRERPGRLHHRQHVVRDDDHLGQPHRPHGVRRRRQGLGPVRRLGGLQRDVARARRRHLQLRARGHLERRRRLLLTRGNEQAAARRDHGGLQRCHQPERSDRPGCRGDLLGPCRSVLDGLDRQRRGHRLRDLPQRNAADRRSGP